MTTKNARSLLQKTVLGAAAALTMAAGSANAAMIVDDWTFDFRGIDGLPSNAAYVINGIDQVGFIGAITQAIVNDANANGTPNIGETFTTTGYGNASEFKNDATGTIGVPLLNFNGTFAGLPGFEVTFRFSTTGVFTPGGGATTPTFDHTSATLQLYVDNLSDGSKSGAANGQGSFTDGTLFATFTFVNDPNDGGSLDLVTGNGNDNLVVSYASGIAGVIKSTGGVDIANGQLLAITGSDFDTDPNNTGTPFSYTSPLFTCGTSAVNFCAVEDGSFVLAQQVPEPGSMLLVGAALAGLGFTARRSRKA